MTIWNYLWERRRALGFFLLLCILLTLSFMLYRLPLRAVLYPAGLCGSVGLVIGAADYFRLRRRHRALAQCDPLLVPLPEAGTAMEAEYRRLVQQLRSSLRAVENQSALRRQELADHYTLWAHQIKTPIASMELQLEQEDSALSRQLKPELFRIAQYVEMALVIQRLDDPGSDYVFRQQPLDDIIRQAVKKYAAEFILRRLELRLEPADLEIVTDEKWLGFVIEQLLSNALKYTPAGSIRIYAQGDTLYIQDTGVGISPEDLPRIFEKGFTGYNGRADKSASGLGLYLCRQICDRLGHRIQAASTLGVGSVFCIHLDQQRPGVE